MMPTPTPPQPPSDATARSFTFFLVPPPPPMTVFLQLGDGQQLQFSPSPERLLSSLLGGAPLVFPLENPSGATGSGFWAGMENDAMVRALHELFARNQSETHGPPPTSKTFLDQLPLKAWDAAACADDKYTDCPICLSEYETADQVLSLPCGHAFHKDCGLPWLKDHNVCPTCRYQLPTRDEAPAAKPTAAPAASAPEPRETAEPDQEQEPEFEQMLHSLLGVRRERSPTFAEPQVARVVRQRVEEPTAPTLPGAVDSDAALDDLLEEEASRFVEEEKRKSSDSDAAMFDDVDLEELLRDAA